MENEIENKDLVKSNKKNEINLDKKSKLRKLKKTVNESKISEEEFEKRLRNQYNEMNKNNSNKELYLWASGENQEENNEDENRELDKILKTNNSIINNKKVINDSNLLSYKKCEEITKKAEDKHSSVLSTLNFHPIKNNLVITSGIDKKVKIFDIDFNDNMKSNIIKVINTLDIPVSSLKFLSNEEIIITGKRKHYFTYNLESQNFIKSEGHFPVASNKINSLEKCFVGKDLNVYGFGDENGTIYLYDIKTKRFKFDLKIPSTVNSICFDNNNYMFSVGDQSEIYIYDLRKYRECFKKVNDYGNLSTNCMEISDDYSYISTGGKQGYVNLYSKNDFIKNENTDIEPLKIYDNLTTSCDFLKFNKTNDMLGMGSKWKKNALRFVNLNTKKVYSNFPSFKINMKYPFCLDFNCDNSLLSIGNDEGRAFLFEIQGY